MTAAPRLDPAVTEKVTAVLAKLRRVKRSGAGWTACCPAHEDGEPSLSVSVGGEGVLIHCHTGCPPSAVARALGLDLRDLFFAPKGSGPGAGGAPAGPRPLHATRSVTPAEEESAAERWPVVATYDYTDLEGRLVFQVLRKEPPVQVNGNRKKTFRQRRPDADAPGGWAWSLKALPEAERPLYRWPEVAEAVAHGRPVFVVEGEKDADRLAALGYCATTCAMGAEKWGEAYGRQLAALAEPDGPPTAVVVLPDDDDKGRAHAAQVAATCQAAGCRVKVVALPDLPPKGDVSDWLDGGGTLDDLDALVSDAPAWRPEGEARPTRWRLDELWEDDAVMRPPPPVVPRLAWYGRSTLLAAPEKTGKSTLTGYIAAAVSRGAPWLDGDEPCNEGRPGVVLLVGLEEFVGDAARRLRAFHADPRRVYVVDRLPSDPRQRPEALARHVAEVTALSGGQAPALVIVDSLIAYAEGQISDAGASAQAGPVVQALTRLAHETGVALVLIHHARKADGRYRDSSAIGGAVDVIVEVFAPDEEADPTLRKARARGRVPAHDFAVRFHGTGYALASLAQAAPEERILAYVRANPGAGHAAVRRAVGGRAESADAAVARLLQAGRLADHMAGDYHHYRVNDRGSFGGPSSTTIGASETSRGASRPRWEP